MNWKSILSVRFDDVENIQRNPEYKAWKEIQSYHFARNKKSNFRGASTNRELIGISVFDIIGCNSNKINVLISDFKKNIVSFIAHFCLSKYSFSLNTFKHTTL